MSARKRPSVAVLSVGDPESPGTWSGTTVGLLGALRGMGVETHALGLSLPRGLEQALLVAGAAPTRNRYDAESAPLTVRVRSALLGARLRGSRLDGLIQIGSTFQAPAGIPYVTLEDMTLRQAGEIHPIFARMSPRAVASWEKRRRGIYSRARKVAVASHWVQESLLVDYGLDATDVAVVGLGANHQIVPAADRRWAPPRFLFVGIDWERKGGPQLLRAFARLREERPEAMLDVVGGHPPVSQPGVAAHGLLSLERPADNRLMGELFAQASCLVMPSLVEPFGIVHVEAGAAGIPSIGTSVGGPRDVIGAEGGLVVDPHNEEELQLAMLRMSDPETARRMGQAASRRAQLYTWERVTERLLRALELDVPDGRELAAYL